MDEENQSDDDLKAGNANGSNARDETPFEKMRRIARERLLLKEGRAVGPDERAREKKSYFGPEHGISLLAMVCVAPTASILLSRSAGELSKHGFPIWIPLIACVIFSIIAVLQIHALRRSRS